MIDPAEVKRQYRLFAERECKDYSEVYYSLALAVVADDDLAGFVADRSIIQPNLFFTAVQFLIGADAMPRTAAELSIGCPDEVVHASQPSRSSRRVSPAASDRPMSRLDPCELLNGGKIAL